jgi:hypothetical protein
MNAPLHDPDRLVDLVEDGESCGQHFPADEYEQWRLDVRAADDLATLLQWARETLPAAVLPCRCADATCLRCLTDRIVAERSDPLPPAAAPDTDDDPPF